MTDNSCIATAETRLLGLRNLVDTEHGHLARARSTSTEHVYGARTYNGGHLPTSSLAATIQILKHAFLGLEDTNNYLRQLWLCETTIFLSVAYQHRGPTDRILMVEASVFGLATAHELA